MSSKNPDFKKLRRRITTIDQRILKLLSERRDVARSIIEFKQRNGMPLRDSRREEALLSELVSRGRDLGLDSHFVTRVFHEIIDDSVRSQQLVLQ